jgi:hypothetical protein
VPRKFWRQFWQCARKVFRGKLAKCREIFWRQIYEMPLISNSGSFQEMPPKLFPSSFGKVPANPNRRSNWKMLVNPNRYTKIQILESQSKSGITITIQILKITFKFIVYRTEL